MTRWYEPPVWVTMALIGLFAYAYISNPADESMKGALIAAFAAAYGYWIGANQQSAKSTENTGKAFDAITAAASSTPGTADPSALREGDSVTLEKP